LLVSFQLLAAAISEELECSTHFGVLSSFREKVDANVVFNATRPMKRSVDTHQNGPKVKLNARTRLLVP
jgi:hypothetical protein